ncbi:hypothetical protein KIW84_044336, partial [Lathyrus oleraceus]
EWKKLKVDARNEFVIKEKIKLLKGSFRKWNREVFGWHDLKVVERVEDINDIDNLLFQCEGIEVQELVERRSLACKSTWRNLYIKDNTLFPKSRVKSNKEGDLNSKCFHNLIKARARKKYIGSVETDRGKVESVEEVKEAVRSFFKSKFSEPGVIRTSLEGLTLNTISESEILLLEAPFTEEEIRAAVWSCDGAKSPGPDGFNFVFIKKCWFFMKEDIISFGKYFHEKAYLPKVVISAFLTLILKVAHPSNLGEYKPVCLVGSLYKILAKLLATTLKDGYWRTHF